LDELPRSFLMRSSGLNTNPPKKRPHLHRDERAGPFSVRLDERHSPRNHRFYSETFEDTEEYDDLRSESLEREFRRPNIGYKSSYEEMHYKEKYLKFKKKYKEEKSKNESLMKEILDMARNFRNLSVKKAAIEMEYPSEITAIPESSNTTPSKPNQRGLWDEEQWTVNYNYLIIFFLIFNSF
jgi:hypothetical protein